MPIALSKVLGVSMSYLLSPSDVSLEGVEFRKLASTKARERAMVEGAVLDYVDRYLQVEQLLDISSAQWEEPKEELFDEVGRRRHALGYAELIEIKQMFGVSAAALVVRLRDLGIITEATLRGVFSGVGRGWRKVEPDPLERDEPTRRFRRLCFRALAEEAISESKAAELLGLPVSEIERIMSGPAG